MVKRSAPPAAPAAAPAAPAPAKPVRAERRTVAPPPTTTTLAPPRDEPQHDALPVAPATTPPAAPSAPAAQAAPSAPSTPAASKADAPTTSTAASGNGPAHAILQPLPSLPDDLREDAYQAVATARFSVHPDGSADVELIKPTHNPRLNQLLLDALKKWRFFPAMQNGHAVESSQDIRVHFNVD